MSIQNRITRKLTSCSRAEALEHSAEMMAFMAWAGLGDGTCGTCVFVPAPRALDAAASPEELGAVRAAREGIRGGA